MDNPPNPSYNFGYSSECVKRMWESFMENTGDIPLWVHLAFSSVSTRRAAMWLIWVCVVSTLYGFLIPLFM